MTIHVFPCIPRLPRLLYAEARGVASRRTAAVRTPLAACPPPGRRRSLGGRGVRRSFLVASLAAGLVIALLTVHLAGAWESPAPFFYRPDGTRSRTGTGVKDTR